MSRLQQQTQKLIALCLLAIAPTLAWAEQKVEHKGYIVHYAAIRTIDLTPEVARQYGIKRSDSRIMLMMNVQNATEPGVALSAKITGYTKNLIGQIKGFKIKEERSGENIYHLGTAGIAQVETLRFIFEVQPAGSDVTVPVEWEQRFY